MGPPARTARGHASASSAAAMSAMSSVARTVPIAFPGAEEGFDVAQPRGSLPDSVLIAAPRASPRREELNRSYVSVWWPTGSPTTFAPRISWMCFSAQRWASGSNVATQSAGTSTG